MKTENVQEKNQNIPEMYQIFDVRKSLRQNVSGRKIPLLKMEQLRALDFPISRGRSWERTVDEFLLQLETNAALRPLRNCAEMVILLHREGALIRTPNGWELLFTPEGEETEDVEGEDPVEIWAALLRREKQKEVCRVRVPDRSLKELVSGIAPFSVLDEYCKKQPGRYLAVAERIVYEGVDVLTKHVPVCRYGELLSADKEEIENYHTVKALLDDYIYQFDHLTGDRRLQPLSLAVFGAPGCGKSFGVRQIAGSCSRFSVTGLNLSQLNSPQELFEALREALQFKNSSIPLVFIDEFDSDLNGTPRGWLRYFLAPMQDGEFTLNGKVIDITAAVFVFAGATASSFQQFLPATPEETEAFRQVKGSDFVSRLKGILNVKGPNPVRITDRSAVIRRAMLLREQIFRRCPGICVKNEVRISRALLSAMLGVSEYRHGTRSLELILAMSCLSGVKRFTPSCLPMEGQLNLHLNARDFMHKMAFEQIMGDEVERNAQIAHERGRESRLAELSLMPDQDEAKKERENPELAPWEELEEAYKESYRSRIRYLGEHLMAWHVNIGLRPVVENTQDAITELYGPNLEELARIDHDRWMRDKQADGWRLGKFDREMKLTPELVPYDDLDKDTQEQIRRSLRSVPSWLREIGYELYTKSF